MIDFFIPSKNRAAQLDLLLRSIKDNAPFIKPHILWDCNIEYLPGYEIVMKEHDDCVWIEEQFFNSQFYEFLEDRFDSLIGLFTDDCVVFRQTHFDESLLDDNTWCFSMRLGYNTIMHGHGIMHPLMPEYEDEKFIRWAFDEYHPHINYGFYFSWDGIIYRSSDLYKMLRGTNFTKWSEQENLKGKPLTIAIENYMCNRRDECHKKMIAAQKRSSVVCLDYNATYSRGDMPSISTKDLNKAFMDGLRIDYKAMDFSKVNSTHHTLPLRWYFDS